MTTYAVQSNDGRWLVLDVYQRIYRLVKNPDKRGIYKNREHAVAAMEDAAKQFKPRSGVLALAVFEINETKPTAHTPTPFEICEDSEGKIDICAPGAGDMIADLSGCDNAEANAAFIVRAVNCHDELVGFLQMIANGGLDAGRSL